MEMDKLKKNSGLDLFIMTTLLMGLTAVSFVAYTVKTVGELIESNDDMFEELDEEIGL